MYAAAKNEYQLNEESIDEASANDCIVDDTESLTENVVVQQSTSSGEVLSETYWDSP